MASYYQPVQQAYESDPNTQLAQALAQRGMSGGPLRTNTQSIAQVLAAAIGAAGGIKQRKEYGAQNEAYGKSQNELLSKLLAGDEQGAIQAAQGSQYMAPQAFQLAGQSMARKQAAAAKAIEPYNLNTGERRFVGDKMIAEGAPKLPDGMVMGPDGQPQFMPAFLEGKKQIAGAGRPVTNVAVNNDKAFGGAVAKNIADRMDMGAQKAQSAVQTLNSVGQIEKALASGKIITGTGANIRLPLEQLASTLGLGGANSDEILANTRSAIQGLSKLALEGRQQMTGQGAISNAESQLAERVAGGDISLTPAELKMLTGAARRTANYFIGQHKESVTRMKKDPNLAPYAEYYDVQPMSTDHSSMSDDDLKKALGIP